MARRKNLKRRRVILSNTFHLIRENGMENVSFQMIAEKSGISKSLLQSYYSHKAKLTDDVVSNILNTLDEQVGKLNDQNKGGICARTEAFIYTIAMLGIYDKGLDRIISEVFSSNKTLDNWSRMLNGWIKNNQLFTTDNFNLEDVRTGLAFVVTGVGRLYHDRERHNLTAKQMADYATGSLMYSFLHCTPKQIDQALADGHKIIAGADIKEIHHAIDTMFDEGKDIVC
ncbi:TetR/AcrR family transcriptional regulator [Lactobacillus sp. ESL0785]|uniref:TetR/AcrR family transcriptional regulator n=1 Tax=Lactobacillus sp. ESL0785 TaxID=2983232 RepID=UPI0023F6B77B|nr:TetR/AcrR family transcriptional regulator [Lactobacillus sp. ESL0785]WEV70988.1 TetR/AcrR family transcriptional regulator [Lactobacillus sp. ESL0785]